MRSLAGTLPALATMALGVLVACAPADQSNAAQQADGRAQQSAPQVTLPATTTVEPSPPLVSAARAQVGVTVRYDPAYVSLDYPGGDVPADRGVCTDVVIRALRPLGLDLQRAVHEDIRANFSTYPQTWGLRGPDRNIDHRRVPNLQRWFARHGWEVTRTDAAVADRTMGLPGPPASRAASTQSTPDTTQRGTARLGGAQTARFQPGDLVTWMLPGNLPHIGVVSDRLGARGAPLVIHNIGAGTREEDVLHAWRITGHYRPQLAARARAPADTTRQ